MKFERRPMVSWFDIRILAKAGLKSVISSTFGNFADKREMQAALKGDLETDYSNNQEIWVDFIADLGDGFDSTYTMASLLACKELNVDGELLPRANILIMGGDQVYAMPSKEDYDNRMKGPYTAAFPKINGQPKTGLKVIDQKPGMKQISNEETKINPHLYALPGNHDWYDGLGNFLKIFCQQRFIGNWQTQQSRSYFAVKLPANHWIWAIDVQLHSDIDQPQLDYFKNIVQKNMEDGATIILCTAEPAWVRMALNERDETFTRLKNFFTNYILLTDKKVRLIATLTGDLHHYSRYEDSMIEKRRAGIHHLITAGGGGSFLHPTHILKEKIEFKDEISAKLKTVYPSKKMSRMLALRNLLFPFYNPAMTFFIGLFFLYTAWLLQSSTVYTDDKSFMYQVANYKASLTNIGDFGMIIIKCLRHNPSVLILHFLLVGGFIGFADANSGRFLKYLLGGLHGLIQLGSFYIMFWIFARINLVYLHMEVAQAREILLSSAEFIIIGGFVSAFIFGLYLLISILLFHLHPTEAFSSFRWTGYKNFLRIHISEKGVIIYPIGVKRAVRNWKNVGSEEEPKFEGDKIEYTLIENPIHILKN
ncbi:MAG: hypothetical protein WBB31_01785 [Saprospiraceae bacterium]